MLASHVFKLEDLEKDDVLPVETDKKGEAEEVEAVEEEQVKEATATTTVKDVDIAAHDFWG